MYFTYSTVTISLDKIKQVISLEKKSYSKSVLNCAQQCVTGSNRFTFYETYVWHTVTELFFFLNDSIVFHFAKDWRCSATCVSGCVNRVLCFDKVSPVFKIVLKHSEKTVSNWKKL